MESVPDPPSRAEDGEPQTVVIGANKPLHRFIKGEPKSIGIVMLFLGGSQFLLGIPMKLDIIESSAQFYTVFWLGIMFITSGILYILSDQNPSKKLWLSTEMPQSVEDLISRCYLQLQNSVIKMKSSAAFLLKYAAIYNKDRIAVTASIALSIISVIGSVVAFFLSFVTIFIAHGFHSPYYHIPMYDNMTHMDFTWTSYHADQILCLESLLLIYCIVGGVIQIVMSTFARAGLRSSRTQAVVVMHNRQTQLVKT